MKSPELSHFLTLDQINKIRENKKILKPGENKTPKNGVGFELTNRKNKHHSTQSYKILKKSTIRSFSNRELDRKMRLYDSYETVIKWIDFFTMVFNLGTISIFYIEHFEYLENGFTLNSTSNIIRGVLLFLSILISIGIFFRYILNEYSLKIISKLNNSDIICILYYTYY
jgi:hypothetical protein